MSAAMLRVRVCSPSILSPSDSLVGLAPGSRQVAVQSKTCKPSFVACKPKYWQLRIERTVFQRRDALTSWFRSYGWKVLKAQSEGGASGVRDRSLK